MRLKILAAKIALAISLVYTTVLPAHAGGIPVIDGTNLSQNILTAMESVAQTLNQIEQYRTQLLQYENQLQNSLAPTAYIWERSQMTMTHLISTIDTLRYYKSLVGDLDGYLGKFQDVAYYRGSPCFRPSGCSNEEWLAMQENRRLASEAQKRANDAWFRGIEMQQEAIVADARTLERLQVAAQGATGQMQAIQFANQFASQQANQLLQIRGLLVSQQNAVASRLQTKVDSEAKRQVASEQLRSGVFRTSPERSWMPGTLNQIEGGSR